MNLSNRQRTLDFKEMVTVINGNYKQLNEDYTSTKNFHKYIV